MERQKDYLERFRGCPQRTSDYSFSNLWGWAKEYGLEWAWAEKLVWIKQTMPVARFWAPIGPWFEVDWNTCLEGVAGGGDVFHRIPEKLIRLWQEEIRRPMVVEEERNQWDYIYGFDALLKLKGNQYHKKKNLLNQFKKKYQYQYVPLGKGLIAQAQAMQQDWCTWRDCESSDALSAENRVIERVLRHWEGLIGVYGGALLVDDSLVAYTIAENLSDDTLVIHFEKGSTEYRGVYQAINQIFLESLNPVIQWVNREQDLGDEGLRKSKISYHPVGFMNKYRVVI